MNMPKGPAMKIRRAWCHIHGHHWGFWFPYPTPGVNSLSARVCQRCGEKEISAPADFTLEMLCKAIEETRDRYRLSNERPIGERYSRD